MAHHIEPPKFDGSKVFFTSDTHFYHDNIIRYCRRPFKDAAHMDEVLIQNWNDTVGSDDIVFHLGDFSYGGSAEWVRVLNRLNGKIYLIVGNHDIKNLRQGYYSLFEISQCRCTSRLGSRRYISTTAPSCAMVGYIEILGSYSAMCIPASKTPA
jgi:predicted phosphodiesterase